MDLMPESVGFLPHGHCFLWIPGLLWMNVVADAVIVVSYFSIPFSLWYFMHKRPDMPFGRLAFLFGLFVLACGTTHLMSIVNLWNTAYWAEAGIKAFTGVASAVTAIALWRYMPIALAIPSRAQLEILNQQLRTEIRQRMAAEGRLSEANLHLEAMVAQRTAELARTNQELQGELERTRAAQFKIGKLSRLYAALSRCNDVIIHSKTPDALFSAVCKIAVEEGGIKFAWVGMVDTETREVKPVADSGSHDSFLASVHVTTFVDDPLSQGPGGTALRENRPCWIQDIRQDRRDLPWLRLCQSYGWSSVAALPIHRNETPVGTLTLCMDEPGYFDAEIQSLLIEMVEDISFALDTFDQREEREKAQKLAKSLMDQMTFYFKTSPVISYSLRMEGTSPTPLWTSENVQELLGYSVEEALHPLWWAGHVHPEDREQAIWETMGAREGDGRLRHEYRFLHKNGSVVWIRDDSRWIQEDGGKGQIVGAWMDMTEKMQAEQAVREHVERIERMMMGTLDAISSLVEMRDPYTAGHEHRVGLLAAAIAAEMGLDEDMQMGLRAAGAVHDVGKISIPSEILTKPARLSALEYEMVKAHATLGYEVLKKIDSPWPIAEIARQHHERMDGSGYPQGLRGEEILRSARIMAVADVVESMASHRPYRPGLGIQAALEEIERNSGHLFDREAVDACLRLFREKRYVLPDQHASRGKP